MAKFPWLKLRKKTDPELPLEPPIWFGNHSNGEYYHPQTPREAFMREEILRRSEGEARRHGMDRRANQEEALDIHEDAERNVEIV